MKKNLLSVVMAGLLFIGLTSMVNLSPAAEPYDCKSTCEWLVDDLGLPSLGACISWCRSCTNEGNGKGVEAVCFCNTLEAYGILEEQDINFGQCVKIVKSGED